MAQSHRRRPRRGRAHRGPADARRPYLPPGQHPAPPHARGPLGRTAQGRHVHRHRPPGDARSRALTADEIAGVSDEFRRAAAAVAAGFDGVEIHGGNGYLVHQFLSSNANERTDRYGGSVARRIRFATEVTSAVVAEIGADRTGLRISPGNPYNDITEHDMHDVHPALLDAIDPLGIAYLHLIQGRDDEFLQRIRRQWSTALIVNRGGTPLGTRFRRPRLRSGRRRLGRRHGTGQPRPSPPPPHGRPAQRARPGHLPRRQPPAATPTTPPSPSPPTRRAEP
ncbi:oxidoreductase [Streptomyces sp. NBC_00258]|uniref:oxidoreductase n=1 Tax=Streptomyces sp. NBC_00258 TaxID=2903642 RepID=UPI002E2B2D89|nr:hypothetical protein [Streptomyces sp. NBC_00258]